MLTAEASHVGRPMSRIDGPLKVTGAARYAAEYAAPDLLCGVIVSATVAAGRVLAIHAERSRAIPGVVEIFTHENARKAAWLDRSWRDDVAPPGHPLRPLYSDRILFDGQPVALVVAETFEAARDAASLMRVDYEIDSHCTELERKRSQAYVPPRKRSGIPPPPDPRGDAETAFAEAPIRITGDYRVNAEHHNPMEMFGTTCVFEGDGKVTIYEKTQGSQNTQGYVASVFGLSAKDVRVVNHYVGGAFGSALRPQPQLFLAVMASLELRRSVRVTLTRAQMFHVGYRPDNFQTVSLACDRQGRLLSVMHDAVAGTSCYEDYQEVIVNWSGMMYRCDNVKLSYQLAQLNTATPCDMRAPGAAVGVTALECAVDELAYAAGIDPLEMRRLNFAMKDENTDKEFTSKALEACYREGAAAFGWEKRKRDPRSQREGRELVGWGMATGMWDAFLQKAEASARLTADGRLEIATAASDIGTGTWTILTQIAADALGLPLEAVTARIGDSLLPTSPVEGGSWTAASNGSAVQAACDAVKATLFKYARKMANSPLADADIADIDVKEGRVFWKNDPDRGLSVEEIMHAADHEEAMTDHRLGKIMNHNLAEYHIPAHADVENIEVIFVEENDDKVSPIGVKGLGEIGIVGTAAAVANAIFHATGKRVRDFPITIDKLLV